MHAGNREWAKIRNSDAAMLDKAIRIKLTEPRARGSMPIEQCISQRRSVRGFHDRALTEQELSQLLWAAQGITAADGRRAVPSAGALYPLELCAICNHVADLSSGVYRYDPTRHELLLLAPGHHRKNLVDAAFGQEWIATAPAVICISAVLEHTMGKYGARGRGYVYMEAGHAAESLMLQAVALGLATTMVGAFSDDEVKKLLHLTPNETPLCLLPVGAP